MTEYKIIDNFLPKKDFNDLSSFMLSTNFPWFYENSITYKDLKNTSYELDNYYFVHQFYKENQVNSKYFYLLDPFSTRLNIFSLIRIQANLYTRTERSVHHQFHTDSFNQKTLNWTTGVFYVNSNNGKTIIKTSDNEQEIESIENRMLLFPAKTQHKSITCTNSKTRVVINFNYYSNNGLINDVY